MHPALSVILFTTLAGAAQGLVVLLAVAQLMGVAPAPTYVSAALMLALILLVAALIASFFHLGRPERAWRAATMWRTSWLSREVIVLPAFIGVVALWWLAQWQGFAWSWLALAAIAMAALLWLCTAMIYACLKFIEEWAHPLTLVNYTLLGIASGCVLGAALAVAVGAGEFALQAARAGLWATLAGAITRVAALIRNARLTHRSTLATAIGVRAPQLRQISMGMTAGSFNTREFFHGVRPAALRHIKLGFMLTAFVVPVLLLAFALITESGAPIVLACAVQLCGLLAERWFFFAQAQHPQNLYYQVVS